MRRWESLVSYILYGLSALAIGYALFILIMLPFDFRAQLTPKDFSERESFGIAKLKPIEEIQKLFSSHALFSKPRKEEAPKGPTLEQMLQPYSLAGIVQGESPEALIQNKTTGRTNFVQTGQSFDQFKVIQIKNHSIIVERDGQQKELFISEGLR